MNILRELRKFKRKSVITKLQVLLVFAIMLVASTYAWWLSPEIWLTNLKASVESWDVEYVLEEVPDTPLEKEITISVDEFKPGMADFEKAINVRNLGTKSSSITCELTSIKLFGVEVLNELKTNNEIKLQGDNVILFANEAKYPFEIFYKCEKSTISGQYVDDTTTPDSVARIAFYASWEYEKGSNEDDELDTSFGQKAYDYYNDSTSAYNDPTSKIEALQFTVKITTKAI